MNPLTLEWIQKAEGDYRTAQWLQQDPDPVYDSICFHAQQCIEKYLKAWLQEANIPVPRTHNLEELLMLILPTLPAWSDWQPAFKIITAYAGIRVILAIQQQPTMHSTLCISAMRCVKPFVPS